MDVAYGISLLALVSWPVITSVGFLSSFYCPARANRSRVSQGVLLAVLYVGMCLALGLVVRADPGGVLEWWID